MYNFSIKQVRSKSFLYFQPIHIIHLFATYFELYTIYPEINSG